MPTTTFHHLPEARRQTLIDIAIEEFGAHPYASASLSRIVARAGIAKGSIYQYFEDKQDFFLYLLEYAIQMQLSFLRNLPPLDDQGDFFTTLRWQMSASVRVGLMAPSLVRLLRRAVDSDLPFRKEVERIIERAGKSHFDHLLREAYARGELAAGLDLELAAYVLQRVLGELGFFVLHRLGLTAGDATANLAELDTPAIEAIYDSVIEIMRYGLAAHGESDHTTGV